MYDDGSGSLPDPYFIRDGWKNDPSLWPDLTYGDIYHYVINAPGMFSRESMKAYKSLDAYRFAVSGNVHEVWFMNIDNTPFCLLKAKVTPSMRIRDKPHEPWVYLCKEDSAVYCAHCTCMAGLGEVCSHVAALLFKVEIAVKLGLTKKSSTSDACKWNASFRKQLEPLSVQEMNDRGLLRGNRKKAVSSVYASGRATLPSNAVLQSLHSVCPNAAFFSSVPGFHNEETDSDPDDNESYPQVMTSFYDEENEALTDDVISTKCNFIASNLTVSAEQCERLELATRDQTVSKLWYHHRKGRITGTKAHDVLVRRQTTNTDNLTKQIVGYKSYDLSNKTAVKYGIDHEDEARKMYITWQQQQHTDFTCRHSGLMIDHKNPCLAATADGIVSCECCGKGVIEVKCPFTHRNGTVAEAARYDSNFCLEPDAFTLKTTHRYYTQVQLQMHVNNVTYCDFVVFTKPSEACLQITRVSYSAEFCEQLARICVSYWLKFVLPELVSGRLASKPASVADIPSDTSSAVWCICAQPEYGKMIKCDEINCKIEWFHYACVNVKRKPTRKWVCPRCKL